MYHLAYEMADGNTETPKKAGGSHASPTVYELAEHVEEYENLSNR